MRKAVVALAFIIYLLVTMAILSPVSAQVPITVWGYVKMPDGSPAVGASVKVSAGGVSKTTTTDSKGKYKVDLTVPSTPVKVTVTAKKGNYRGSASKTGEGVIHIDIVLKYSPPPSKKSTSLELSAGKEEYIVGEVVTVKGCIKPAMKVTVTVTIVQPNGTSISNSVETEEDGTFTYSFEVDKPGVWKVYAKYAGSRKYASSTSPTVEIVVKEATQVTMNAIAVEPRKVIVEGILEPSLAGATIIIYVSLDEGETWLPICNTTTDETGHYRVELEFTVGGNMLFKAMFPGTENYTNCETEVPPAIKLPAPGEEEFRKKEEELNEKLTELKNENKQLKEKIEELTGELTETKKTLEELNTTLTTLKKTNEKYKTIAFIGTPLAAIASIAVGIVVGRKVAKT